MVIETPLKPTFSCTVSSQSRTNYTGYFRNDLSTETCLLGGVVTINFFEDMKLPVFQWLNSSQEFFQLSNKCVSLRKYFERQVSD